MKKKNQLMSILWSQCGVIFKVVYDITVQNCGGIDTLIGI